MPAALQARGFPRELSPTSREESPPLEAGTITLAVLPDTQYYADCDSPHFSAQTQFVAREAKRRNIRALLTLGDLTEHNVPREWDYVRAGVRLVQDEVPVVLVSGNHDHGEGGTANRRATRFREHFPAPPGRAAQALAESLAPGDLENAYYRVETPRVTLGFLALEWSPRTATVAWANRVLARYPKDRVVVLTHAYLYHDDTRYDWWKAGSKQEWNPLWYRTAKRDSERETTRENLHPDGAADGEMLWNTLVRKHPGIFLVLSGHVLEDGNALLTSRGDNGNVVQQVLVNYQMLREGGLGYLRLLELLPDGRTLRMKTYSPSLQLFATAKEQARDLGIEPALW